MVSKVRYLTEIGYFGRSQNVREVRAEAPPLASMITAIASLPSCAARDETARSPAQVYQLQQRLPGARDR